MTFRNLLAGYTILHNTFSVPYDPAPMEEKTENPFRRPWKAPTEEAARLMSELLEGFGLTEEGHLQRHIEGRHPGGVQLSFSISAETYEMVRAMFRPMKLHPSGFARLAMLSAIVQMWEGMPAVPPGFDEVDIH